MATLYPRVGNRVALDIYNEIGELSISELRLGAACTHPQEYFASTGGNRISKEEIDLIAKTVREFAVKHGYPEKVGNSQSSAFDGELARWLSGQLAIIDGEGARAEMWSFVSLLVLPDVVKWRFQNFHRSRCLGGRRNCFQRLWLRGKIFDLGAEADDRWRIVDKLTEDAFVSIIERPSIAENRDLARIVGLCWIEAQEKVGAGNMEKINRTALRSLRASFTLYEFDCLENEELSQLVHECYEKAILLQN